MILSDGESQYSTVYVCSGLVRISLRNICSKVLKPHLSTTQQDKHTKTTENLDKTPDTEANVRMTIQVATIVTNVVDLFSDRVQNRSVGSPVLFTRSSGVAPVKDLLIDDGG